MSTAVVPRDEIEKAHLALPPAIREKVSPEEMRAVILTQSRGVTLTDVVFGYILQEETGLSLARRELYLARSPARDGRPGQLLAMAGVNGLVRNAEKHKGYAGHDGDAVRQKDEFRVERLATGERQITHKYSGSDEDRGALVGAWAQVYRHGRSTVYFYAPWKEYAPRSPKPGSSWLNYPSAMISKCALSICLRRAFDLSGVVGEEEVARLMENEPGHDAGAGLQDVLNGIGDEELRSRLQDAYDEAQAARPGQLSAAVIQMSVAGQPREVVQAFVERVERENEEAEVRAAEEEPADAEVVPDVELDPEAQADVEALRRQLSDLLDRRTDVEENPGSHGDTERALAEIDEEIGTVEAALRAAGANVPGQESLI